ncbi:MAG: glycerol-3-phosphate dehydrogenase/oxidase [Anaerolineae bacterium]|nr:glycerol-3-phosphate dehydrogenase/oxidase [Anaerolineae bacterium]
MNRQEAIEAIRRNPNVTVLIIGGGINGIGVFCDVALQGIDVLLVEKGDFCSGASAASSHMLHGGIRYLENGEFRLVKEALYERNLLLKNAPHYARPLPTTIPIFKWASGFLNAPLKFLKLLDQPSERGLLVIKIGLMLYDAYVRGRSPMPGHSIAWREESLKQYPGLNPDILCTATYYDAAMPIPERICVDLISDAEANFPSAHAVNYLSVVKADGDTVTLHDAVSEQTLIVKPKMVVNAAGPWVDLANRVMGRETHFMGGTKGSHVVLDNPELRAAIADHEFFFENVDGRIVLIYPLADKVLVGTTDIRIDDPDQARCTEEEVDYILGLIGKVFPTIGVDRSQIIFRFSGVRPLPSSDASATGQISRDHSIDIAEPGDGLRFPVFNLIGGKWTTFRAFAEQVTDALLRRIGKPRRRDNRNLPIGGGKGYPRADAERKAWLSVLKNKTRLPVERLETLLDRYGTRAGDLAVLIAKGPDQPLTHRPDYSTQEIVYLATREKCVHLDDLLLRRSMLAKLGQLNPALIEEIAEVVGGALEWTDGERKREIDRTLAVLADRHGVEFENR